MDDFSPEVRQAVEAAYNNASAWSENLDWSNGTSHSDIRDDYIRAIDELQQKIDTIGLFDKNDFTPDEQREVLALTNELGIVLQHIKAQHDLTLIELEMDISDLVQRISLDKFLWLLRSRWTMARRRYPPLPKDIPDIVCDAFHVGLFERAEYVLNQLAARLKPVAQVACLNPDDYSNVWFVAMEMRCSNLACDAAIGDFIQLDIDKKNAAAAAKLNEGPSVGGIIWGIIGWDDPWDFAKDVVLFSVTGGASKLYRYGKKLNSARKLVTKSARALRRLETAAVKLEARLHNVRNAAQRLKRLNTLRRIPDRIKKAFEEFQDARKAYELVTTAGKAVTGVILRGVLTSVATDMAINKTSKSLTVRASNESVRVAAIRALEKVPPFNRIPVIRDAIGWTALFRTRGTGGHDALIGQYVAYVWLQEFAVRIVMAVVHQSNLTAATINRIAGDKTRPIISAKMATDEAIAALGSAVERIWRDDLTFLPEALGEQTARYVVAFGRKTLVKLVQDLVKLATS